MRLRLAGGNVTGRPNFRQLTPNRMPLSAAQKQRAYRARQRAAAQNRPEVIEAALLKDADRADQLSEPERIALADKLANVAMGHLWRAQELGAVARRVRPPGLPQ